MADHSAARHVCLSASVRRGFSSFVNFIEDGGLDLHVITLAQKENVSSRHCVG
jgi:hypothetical protein